MRLPRWSCDVLPFVPFLAGLALATERFRARDPLAGLLFGEVGFVLFLVLAVALRHRAPGARAPDQAPLAEPGRFLETAGSSRERDRT